MREAPAEEAGGGTSGLLTAAGGEPPSEPSASPPSEPPGQLDAMLAATRPVEVDTTLDTAAGRASHRARRRGFDPDWLLGGEAGGEVAGEAGAGGEAGGVAGASQRSSSRGQASRLHGPETHRAVSAEILSAIEKHALQMPSSMPSWLLGGAVQGALEPGSVGSAQSKHLLATAERSAAREQPSRLAGPPRASQGARGVAHVVGVLPIDINLFPTHKPYPRRQTFNL